jgi:hypothetical protein
LDRSLSKYFTEIEFGYSRISVIVCLGSNQRTGILFEHVEPRTDGYFTAIYLGNHGVDTRWLLEVDGGSTYRHCATEVLQNSS